MRAGTLDERETLPGDTLEVVSAAMPVAARP
jgi:hypothetical protein